MISYGNIDKKGADDPDPVNMVPVGKYELRNDKTAGDKLNGSILLDEGSLSAVNAEAGDPVRIYAEANDRWILYERNTYSDRSGVGMPRKYRSKLNLSQDSRTVRIWLAEAEKAGEDDSGASSGSDRGKQTNLSNEQADDQEYVAILDEDEFIYHHVTESGEKTTECGIEFGGSSYKRFTDPGDVFDECSDCAIRSSDEMTNKELVLWLGEQAGFDIGNSGTPAYLSKPQLVALRDLILDLQENQSEPKSDETTDSEVSVNPSS